VTLARSAAGPMPAAPGRPAPVSGGDRQSRFMLLAVVTRPDIIAASWYWP
jgi:hypothetical protein